MKKILSSTARIIITMSLLMWFFQKIDFNTTADLFSSIDISYVVYAFAVNGAAIFLMIFRWSLLLSKTNETSIPLKLLASHFFIGRFIGAFLPGTLGLDGYRLWFMIQNVSNKALGFLVIILEKSLSLCGLSFLLFCSVFFIQSYMPLIPLFRYLIILGGFVSLSSFVLLYPQKCHTGFAFIFRRFQKVTSLIHRVFETLQYFSHDRHLLITTMFLTIIHHVLISTVYMFSAKALGLSNSLYIFAVAPLVISATLLPLTIAGIGVREASFAFFLSFVGVDFSTSAAVGFLGFLIGEFYSFVGGIFLLQLKSHKNRISLSPFPFDKTLIHQKTPTGFSK